MDASETVLKLLLDEIGVEASIESVDDRKMLQKAVYLAQAVSGVDLGYRFSWYLKGPYSPPLARDYYRLAGSLEAGDTPEVAYTVDPSVRAKLNRAKELIASVPDGVSLSLPDWAELVASLDYLRRVSRLSEVQARTVLNEQKPHLSPFTDIASQKLAQLRS